MPGTLISSAILAGTHELMRAHGQHAAGVARRAGVPLAALHDPTLLVSARAVVEFFEFAAQACENRNWGLELSLRMRLAAVIGPLWILLRNARTLREMCTEVAANFDLYSTAAAMTFDPYPDGSGLLAWSPAIDLGDSAVQMAEYALALLCKELQSHCQPGWHPQAVLFAHAMPPELQLHHKLFGWALQFDAPRNAVLLGAADLGRGLESQGSSNRYTLRHILRHTGMLARPEFGQQVESVIRTLMPYAPCKLRDVSAALGVAPRTLQQYLQDEATGFDAIRDRVRAELALKYLRQTRMSAAEIADILGYTDPTSFSRAFKRWHGQTARQARRAGAGVAEPASGSVKRPIKRL